MLAQQLYKLTTSLKMMKKWLFQTLEIQYNQEQIAEQNVFASLRALLIKLDDQMFSELKEQQADAGGFQQNYAIYLGHFQRYLCKKQMKKLKSDFQLKLREAKDETELLKLVLYLSINSHLRKEIVDKILCFQQEQQIYLMDAIKEVERQCQQLIEIKKVIERILVIQSANEQLKMLFCQSQAQLQAEIADFSQIENENEHLASESQIYRSEKECACEEVGSNQLKEFQFQCRKMETEINKVQIKLFDSNAQNLNLEKKNQTLRKELKNYGNIIKKHIQQLERLKSEHLLANQQNLLRDKPQQKNFQSLKLPLQELSRNNLSSSISSDFKKLDTERTNCSFMKEEGCQRNQNKCSLGLLLQIGQAQRQYQQKIEIIQHLKMTHKLQKQRNKKLSKKLERLKNEHMKQNNIFQAQTLKLLA